MRMFEVKWYSSGRAVIEADDAAEAEQILEEGLMLLDSTMFDSLDVDYTDVTQVREIE